MRLRTSYLQSLFFAMACCALGFNLQAQTDLTTQLAEQALIEQEIQNTSDALQAKVDARIDPCETNIQIETAVVLYASFAEIGVKSNADVSLVLMDASFIKLTSLSVRADVDHVSVRVPLGEQIRIMATNLCGDWEELTQLSTLPIDPKATISLTKPQYDLFLNWQRQTQVPIDQFVLDATEIGDFEKAFLMQSVVNGGQIYADASADKSAERKEFESGSPGSRQIPCRCATVERYNNYIVTPIERIRSDGRISGLYGSDTNESREDDKIRLDRYWAYEGPSRYTELFGSTPRKCFKTDKDYTWNGQRNDEVKDLDEQEESGMTPSFRSSIDYNMICFGDNGNMENDCECERTVRFEWDYESVVSADGSKISGGWFCGNPREARSYAADQVLVGFLRLRNASSYEVLASQMNVQSTDCLGGYQGPSFSDFVEFAINAFQVASGLSDSVSTIDSLIPIIEDITENIDSAFEESWFTSSGCQGAVSGNLRRLPENAKNYTTVLRPNDPVQLSLLSGGRMSVGGLRKWRANASIYSSFRLAGIMIGHIDEEEDNNCCTPYIGSWAMSTIAEGALGAGASTEGDYGRAARAFFSRNAINQRVWTQTGDFVNYRGIDCPYPVVATVIRPSGEGATGDGDVGALRRVGFSQYSFEVKEDFILNNQMNHPSLRIIDVAGRQYQQLTLSLNGRNIIATESLSPGVYFAVVEGLSGRPVTYKLIVAN
jgi:hypothetical protein